jgi:hypothetical protein
MASEEKEKFSYLEQAYIAGRLGHALIVKLWPHDKISSTSAPGFFKSIQALLCAKAPANSLQACEECSSCQLFRHWSDEGAYQVHPDLIFLEPENTQGYAVEQIREMARFLALKSHLSPRRVVLINKAEGLRAAHGAPANALLKILEEPRSAQHIFLLTAQTELLLPTLRSRCQQFSLKLLGHEAELDVDWNEIRSWIAKACPPVKQSFRSPPDAEAFWKDRGLALSELELAFKVLWRESLPQLGRWNREEGLRVLDFFNEFEAFLRSVRSFGNGLLQWQNIKTHALRGSLWRQ